MKIIAWKIFLGCLVVIGNFCGLIHWGDLSWSSGRWTGILSFRDRRRRAERRVILMSLIIFSVTA
jgi:hypothetical protein